MAASRFATLAAQTSALKYKPKYSALANAIGEAEAAYKQTTSSGNATAALTTQAAHAALPAIQAAFGRADTANARLTSPDMAALPSTGVTAAFAGGQQDEVRQQLSNLLTARAGAEAQNASVAPAAREGAQFNQLAARQTLSSELGKLLTQRSTIAGEEGSDAATEEEKLLHEAEGNQTSRADAQLSAQTSRQNSIEGNAQQERASQRTAASKAKSAAGVDYLPQTKQTAAASTLREIEKEARGLRDQGHTTGEILQALTTSGGGKVKNVLKTDENGNPIKKANGEPEYERVTTPKIQAHDQLLSEAAIDSVFGSGAVTKQTLAKLHAAGYSIKALGVKVRSNPPAPTPKSVAEHVHAALGF